jgi:transcriptional regulator GlxA family with amidase domain
MRIGLLAVEGCFSSGVAALLDILGTAEATRARIDASIAPIEAVIAGFRKRVITNTGLTVPTRRAPDELSDCDVVVLPATGAKAADELCAALQGRDVRRAIPVLRSLHEHGCTLAAACTGVFVLAETGLLDERHATTTWWLGPLFRQRYPEVSLDLDMMVVRDGSTVTAGAAFSHIDLALSIVREASAALAEEVARLLVIDERAAQSAYVAVDHLVHSDPLLLAFERHVRRNLARALDVPSIAAAIGASRRTLERRIEAALGMSPLALVQRLRVERATHLLETTDRGMEEIAAQVGYANASTLRTLLRRHRAARPAARR